MRKSTLFSLPALATLSLLSGCFGGGTHYYSLNSQCSTSSYSDVYDRKGGTSKIEVFTPVVSDTLDRDRIVYQIRDFKVHQASSQAWSEPVAQMIGRTFVRDLQCSLPESEIYLQNDNVVGQPQVTVGLTITDFALDSSGYTLIAGTASITKQGQSPVLKPIKWRSQNPATSVKDEIQDLSTGLTALANQLKEDISGS